VGEEIIADSNQRFLVVDIVEFDEEDESPFVGMLIVKAAQCSSTARPISPRVAYLDAPPSRVPGRSDRYRCQRPDLERIVSRIEGPFASAEGVPQIAGSDMGFGPKQLDDSPSKHFLGSPQSHLFCGPGYPLGRRRGAWWHCPAPAPSRY
jgi:hypothetical protein